MTERQAEFLKLYNSGMTTGEIARKYGINRSTAARTLRRAQKVRCPFFGNCERCTLEECAFRPEYRGLMNTTENKTTVIRRRTKGGD